MLLLKRLSIWLAEISSQALLLALLLVGVFGHYQYSFGRGLIIYAVSIFTMFCVTGYLLTTAIARAIWKGKSSWLYPFLCTVLFLLHFELLNAGLGGAFAPRERGMVFVVGAVTAFLTTLCGTFFSLKSAHLAKPQ